MTRIRAAGLALLITCAVSAAASATASAALPELSRPGTTEKLTNTGFSSKGGEFILQVSGAPIIACSGDEVSGNMTSLTANTTTFVATSCKSIGNGCKSPGAAAGEITFTATGKLVYINKSKKEASQLLTISSSGEKLTVECGGLSGTSEFIGSFLIPIRKAYDNTPVKEILAFAEQTEGKQKVTGYEESGAKTATLKGSTNGGSSKAAGIEFENILKFEEEVELKA